MGLFNNAKRLTSGDDPDEPYRRAIETAAEPVPHSAIRAIAASGQKINLRSQDQLDELRYRVYSEWQNDAWAYYDAIGEIKYGFGMLGSVMSRVRLYSSLNLDPDTVPISTLNYRRRMVGLSAKEQDADVKREMTAPTGITEDVMKYAERLIKDLGSGPGGISGFLRSYALNMAVPGECYLVKIKNQWMIKSSNEIVVDTGGQVLLRQQRTNVGSAPISSNGSVLGDVILPKNTYMARIWREHPRYSKEPESSMLGLREACDELIAIQQMIRAVTRSNMNAGILFIPEGLTAAGDSVTEDIKTAEQEDADLVKSIYDNLVAPILDETNAATVVPTILTGPAILGKDIKYTTLNREVDQYLTERADRALERILQGLDMPKDFVTGMANVRYTNAKNIDESLYKSHIEPLALMLVDALTVAYLRPLLKAKFPELTPEDLEVIGVWYDPSEVVTKSDPADSADKGFDKYNISADAWRAAHGFSDTDAPSELEVAIRMLQKSTLPPELITSLFNLVFTTIMEKQRDKSIDDNNMPDTARKMLYDKPEANADGTPVQPDDGDSELLADDDTDVTGEVDTLTAAVASMQRSIADKRVLYTTPYDDNTMQEEYRAIAEAAVRDGDYVMVKHQTAALTPTQPKDRSRTQGSGAGAKDLPPIVVRKNGINYLLDGHHRALERRIIDAATVDLDNLRTDYGQAS